MSSSTDRDIEQITDDLERALPPRRERDPHALSLSLVSHTNVGKTSLARTLLREDVGEVLDQAHVTDENEVHTLIETEQGEKLELWDTPGFGDSARLLRRLKRENTRIGWFLSQVWDRFKNRPLWCSQQALRNVREAADIVLYLVNASEDPEDAGYVDLEMEILSWVSRPVIVLLNQTGGGRSRELAAEDLRRWSAHMKERHPIVVDVLELDAFSRCWVQEGVLFEAACQHLEPDRRALLERLLNVWTERSRKTFVESMEILAGHLALAACDVELIQESSADLLKRGRKKAAEKLGERLETSSKKGIARLIEIHQLEGQAAVDVETKMEDFAMSAAKVEPWKAGALGGAVSGALGGLAADFLSGGLSFGGGFVAGAILGAFGSAGLARALSIFRGDEIPRAGWSNEFLEALTKNMALRYLAVAHFGRAHGSYHEDPEPKLWRDAVEAAYDDKRSKLESIWKRAHAPIKGKTDSIESREAEIRAELTTVLSSLVSGVLTRFYPKAAHFLQRKS